jgi:hypothetical protein
MSLLHAWNPDHRDGARLFDHYDSDRDGLLSRQDFLQLAHRELGPGRSGGSGRPESRPEPSPAEPLAFHTSSTHPRHPEPVRLEEVWSNPNSRPAHASTHASSGRWGTSRQDARQDLPPNYTWFDEVPGTAETLSFR